MNSRMERYVENTEEVSSRVSKNQELYSEINNQALSRVRTNNNYRILDDVPKEINVEDIKSYINSLSTETEEKRRTTINSHIEKEEEPVIEEPKIYDINSIIENAKSKKESSYETDKYKKLHNTELDILKKIEIYNKNKYEEETKEEKQEKEEDLMELINTLAHNKEVNDSLLSELTGGSENTIVTKPIQEELESAKEEPLLKPEEVVEEVKTITEVPKNNLSSIDKSFYTNSVNFSKQDFEELDKLEKEVSKTSALLVIGIIVAVVVVVATVVFVLNNVLGLELF